MLKQPLRISVKALDVVPTGKESFLRCFVVLLLKPVVAQRSLTTFDREWDKRNSGSRS